MANNYAKGARNERQVIDLLKDQEYEAMRSAGSHGVFDVIAWNDHQVRFIQVKYGGSAYATDLEKMKAMTVPPNGTKELWHRKKHARKWTIQVVL